MNRRDWYFRRKVEEGDLDELESTVELTINVPVADVYGSGVLENTGVVSQHSPSPDISVDVGVTVAYNPQGFRILVPTTINVVLDRQGDLPIGLGGSAAGEVISMPSSGQERWLSLFLYFDRLATDPKIDGFGLQVMFHLNDTFKVGVIAGTTAASGVGIRPTSNPGGGAILIADVRLHDAATQIFNGDIDVSRVKRILPLIEYIRRTGDTMTGFLTLNDDPIELLHAATKRYVDAHVSPPSGVTTVEIVPVFTITAAEDLRFGDLVYKDSGDNTYRKADNLAKSTMPTVAVVTQPNGILDGQQGTASSLGLLTNSLWGWTSGARLFVGRDGLMVTSPPMALGSVVQLVGAAHAPDKVLFELGTPFVN